MNFIKSTITVMIFLFLLCNTTAWAQTDENNYQEIEKKQDQIEHLYMQAHRIIDKYPDVIYSYVHEDGEVSAVTVEGVTNIQDMKQLEVYLVDMERLKQQIFNQPNRVGVYYVTEKSPEPKEGYRDFYANLQSNLEYPEAAEDEGVEGIVYVKFVVDPEGQVHSVRASEDIEAPGDWIVKELKQEAKNALSRTSGDWTPATIGGVAISQWVVVPVQFKLESPFFLPVF
jgi:TonB family protein